MSLRIEIRDERIGRLSIRAGTDDRALRDAYKASIEKLIPTERGRAIIQRIRDRKVTVAEVHRAVESFDLSLVEAPPGEEPSSSRKELPPIGLGATIDAWLLVLQGQGRRPATLEFYTSIARGLEQHMGVQRDRVSGRILEDRPVASISRAEAEQWLTAEKETTGKPWSPRTQTVAHSLAAQIWDRAMNEDEDRHDRLGIERTILRNFFRRDGTRKGLRAARIRRTRVEFLQRTEAARLLRAVKGTPYAAWVAVGLYAGLRGGEAANLRMGIDVKLKRGYLAIQERGGEFAWAPKSDNGTRRVPIHPRLARWIRAHIRLGYAGELYLFRLAGKDEPLSRSGWRVWTKAAFEAAGIQYGRKKDALTYHSLRHTFASWLTIADVHPLKIAKLMGDDVKEVLRTYSHLVQEDLEEALLYGFQRRRRGP